jgi:phosphate transport system ATP-binding protein
MNKTPKMRIRDLNFFYGDFHCLHKVCLDFQANQVTALIGPSGCGKSTLLRCLNRMNDLIPTSRVQGEVLLDDKNIYGSEVDVVTLRRNIGMVFQKPNPFPKSIFENVAYGLRVNGVKDKSYIQGRVEQSLQEAALWDEVKDRIHESALGLSGGQQQRLCIARAMAVKPAVLLMDEPASALDPIATQKIEELIHKLKETYTIIIVTHNMQEAARVSEVPAFFYLGERIEVDQTKKIFPRPGSQKTSDYITGRFG